MADKMPRFEKLPKSSSKRAPLKKGAAKRDSMHKFKNDAVYALQAELCAALAHPIRLKILDLLGAQELSIGEIQEALGIAGPNLTQHLNVLKKVGLLKARKAGLFQFCTLAVPEVRSACQVMGRVLEMRISREDAAAQALRHEVLG